MGRRLRMMAKEDEILKKRWGAVRSLWMKFCGVADEYKMLRDRWIYLHDPSVPILPYLKKKNKNEIDKTFDLLDKHVNNLEKMFRDFGFKRDELEKFENSKEHLKKLNLDKLELIEEYFYDLTNFTGLLKLAFFQRTISSEITHVASGVPHSSERTLGNELFYLAADKITNCYLSHLNIPYGKWDGFITFIPPITESYFYGAFCRPSPYLELFHISMSEEAKYFVGSYLSIAHELAHAAMVRRWRNKKRGHIDVSSWVKLLFSKIIEHTAEIFSEISTECENCPIFQCINSSLYFVFEEYLADLIAYKISGINYLHNFIDEIYSKIYNKNYHYLLLRVVPLYIFLRLSARKNKDLNKLSLRVDDLIKETEKVREKMKIKCPHEFRTCITNTCTGWASLTKDFNDTYGDIILRKDFLNIINELVMLKDRYNPLASSIDRKAITVRDLEKIIDIIFTKEEFKKVINMIEEGKTLFSMIVRDEFKIKNSTETRIINSLINGEPISDEDPRHILHCYYEAYKQSEGEERPSYGATIYSLAFNTFHKKEKKKKN